MICPDVNVLINAFRPDCGQHKKCKSLLESEIVSGRAYAVSPLTLAAMVRITTTSRFHEEPSTVAECLDFADALLSRSNCVVIEPGNGHWSIFKNLLVSAKARAKLVPDAYYAALAIEHGCEWVTLDRDFGKFKGLKWRLLK